MTPPYTTSTEWATQQPTPTPFWDSQSSSLVPYDSLAEDARLHQAFTLGTSARNTLMQRDNGICYGTILETCQARRSTLQRTMRHYPLLSRLEYTMMTNHYTFINPFGTPEPFGMKQITRRMEGAVEMAIKTERRNGANSTLDLSLLGVPGPCSDEYISQVQRACNIFTRGQFHKVIMSALAGNLCIVLEPRGDTLGAGIKEIADAATGQMANDLLLFFNPAHVGIHKYLHNTAESELMFLYESQYVTMTTELMKGLIPFLHRSIVDRFQFAMAEPAKVITIQNMLYTLLLAPNTPTQQNSQRAHAVADVNVLLPDVPIVDLKRMIENKELSYLLAHGVKPHPNEQSRYEWIKRILPTKYRSVLFSLEAVAIGNGKGPHPPMDNFWNMLEDMSSSQLLPLSDTVSVNKTEGFRPFRELRESTPGPKGSLREQGSWELRRETTILDGSNRLDRPSDRRRGDDRDRNLERGDYRRRDNSQERDDGKHRGQELRRPLDDGRRRSQERDGETDKRREFSRSRSREPEQPANDAKGLAPALEKDKELERKKSRSPSAERGGSQKRQIIKAFSVLQQLADQQH